MYTIIRRGNERNARQVLIDSNIIAQYHSPGDVFRSKLHFHPYTQGRISDCPELTSLPTIIADYPLAQR
jgi:hypothetical protein